MSTLTIRIAELKHARLRRLAASRGLSMNKLVDELDRKSTRLNSSHIQKSRMPSSA